MRPVHFYSIVVSCTLISSCVSTSKYKAMQSEAAKYDTLYNWSMQTLKKCQDENKSLNDQKTVMKQKMNEMDEIVTVTKETDAQLKKQLSALSSISSAQAESLRKSMDNIGAKDNYIQELRLAVTQRDSKNMAVLMELKSILGEAASSVKIVDGAVYATIADSLLFDCDTIACTLKSKKIVSRIARVLGDQPSMTCTVEGNGDSLSDNWDLPVNRATLVVRMLQRDFKITPSRLNATGRNQYVAPVHNYNLDSAISALKTDKNSPVHVDATPATPAAAAAKSDSAAQSTAALSTVKTDTANQPKADSSLATAPKTDSAAAATAANRSDSIRTDSAVVATAVKSDSAAGQSIVKADTALAVASQPKADTALAISTDSTRGVASGVLQPDTTGGAAVAPAVVHPATYTRFIFYPPTEKLQRLLEGKHEQSSQPAPAETGASAANVPASASVNNQ